MLYSANSPLILTKTLSWFPFYRCGESNGRCGEWVLERLSHLLEVLWLTSSAYGIWVLFYLVPDFGVESFDHRPWGSAASSGAGTELGPAALAEDGAKHFLTSSSSLLLFPRPETFSPFPHLALSCSSFNLLFLGRLLWCSSSPSLG